MSSCQRKRVFWMDFLEFSFVLVGRGEKILDLRTIDLRSPIWSIGYYCETMVTKKNNKNQVTIWRCHIHIYFVTYGYLMNICLLCGIFPSPLEVNSPEGLVRIGICTSCMFNWTLHSSLTVVVFSTSVRLTIHTTSLWVSILGDRDL